MSAAHDDELLDLSCDLRLYTKSHRKIRQRADSCDIDISFRLHQRLDEIRLINVITIVPDHVRKIFIADGQFLQHGGSLFEKNST